MTAEGSQRNDGKTLTHKDLEFRVEDQQTQDSWTFFFLKTFKLFQQWENIWWSCVFRPLAGHNVRSIIFLFSEGLSNKRHWDTCKCITSILFFKAYTNDLELVQIFMGRISLNTLHSIWILVIIYLRLIKVFEKRCDT